MLPRLLPSFPPAPYRRAYSFFSSKPGGGRYFNPNKTTKVPASVTTKAPTTQPGSPKPTPAALEPASKQSSPSVVGDGGVSSTSSSAVMEADLTPRPSLLDNPLSGFHPHPNLPTLHLHNFFALDRPLLLLSQPPSALFESNRAFALSNNVASELSSASQSQAQDAFGQAMEDEENDVNAARLLARSLVMQRVSSTMDWSDVMVKLGLPDDARVELDSVKRKRKKKMTKHRYKKRRKLQRAERRRLGK
ncbi:hypothetical protein FRB94_004373 [Tulasnella sp. JGI-2019a]|nr:hypothetical protein FRB93_004781 [Tulasnella sp. JGI-2019a]KAG9012980.1 hypothetical protein FRB94_004373 [Tulasnella sp. JGI-2019a]KAG9036237.1 hypothetical protein FRB95_009600 [Tulasnella sp. JGI-2019a]